jgi:hypothetical protein
MKLPCAGPGTDCKHGIRCHEVYDRGIGCSSFVNVERFAILGKVTCADCKSPTLGELYFDPPPLLL